MQSAYTTLPINGHVAHHYRSCRERDKEATIARFRDRELPPLPHHIDKHHRDALNLELYGNLNGIGTYRA